MFGLASESLNRSRFSVVAALVPIAHALLAVRHQKSSPVISAQAMTQSDVKVPENPAQALVTRFHSPRGIQKSRNQERQHGVSLIGRQKDSSRVHRLHQIATSRKIPVPKHRSGDRLQSTLKEIDDIRNLLSPDVELNPNLSHKSERKSQEHVLTI